MPANPTPEDLRELRVLCEKATALPWIQAARIIFAANDTYAGIAYGGTLQQAEYNAEFMVAAANALPRLLDALEAADLYLKRSEAQAEKFTETIEKMGKSLEAERAKVTTLRDGLDRIRAVATDVWAQDFARQLYEETE